MAKEELIEFEGLVTEILPDTRYRVKLDTGHEIIAYTAGKMKKNRIKTLAGDRVIVEMSPYDLEKGRIIFRHKDDRAATAARPPVRQQFRRRWVSHFPASLGTVMRGLAVPSPLPPWGEVDVERRRENRARGLASLESRDLM